MKVNGLKMIDMVRESFTLKKETFMTDNGKMINGMDRVTKSIKITTLIKEVGEKTINTVTEFINLSMETSMKDIFKKIVFKAKELRFLIMGIDTKAIGKIGFKVEREGLRKLMGQSMSVIS